MIRITAVLAATLMGACTETPPAADAGRTGMPEFERPAQNPEELEIQQTGSGDVTMGGEGDAEAAGEGDSQPEPEDGPEQPDR